MRREHVTFIFMERLWGLCSNGTDMRRSTYLRICAVQAYAECIRDRAEEMDFFGSKYSAYLVTVK
jgi:hypothetical protein